MTWAPIIAFLKKIPDWLILTLIGIAAGKWYLETEKAKARDDERDKADKREAEARTQAIETAGAITDDVQDRVIEAGSAVRDLPQFANAGELRDKRPDIAALLFGDPDNKRPRD
jgi:hypothetical protein